ncbi:MAG: CarD family transcriptional regulator [bacterium]|nr:CarD family transcriptional regulator [bacterium]
MFNINDFVVYHRNVCIINSIKEIDNRGKYYVIKPIDDDSLTISVPIDNKFIRPIISQQQVEELINEIINIDVIDNTNEKMIEGEYKQLLSDINNHKNLIKIIKTTYLRNEYRILNKKKVSEKDNEYFKIAEKLLYNELSVVLQMSYEDTKKYVINKVRAALACKKLDPCIN